MSLAKYQSKRDFSKTSEPKANIKKSKSDRLIYVIQKHQARNLHYDLRLEYKGVLLSWAVPKKPSKSGLKRLAMQTEDHPIDYATFAGIIPKGEYGAGKVEIWDKGYWIPESIKKDKIVFELKGKELSGRFVLVKLKNVKDGWLFFKLKK